MIIKISVPSRFRLKKTATFRTILMQNQGDGGFTMLIPEQFVV